MCCILIYLYIKLDNAIQVTTCAIVDRFEAFVLN